MAGRGQFLFVTWDGGGNLQPALGLGRKLAERRHDVRMMAWQTPDARIVAAGCRPRPFPEGVWFDLALGRAWEDQDDAPDDLFCDARIAEAVLEEIDREPPDALVIDYMLRNAMSAAERTGLPTAALVHTSRGFFHFPEEDEPEIWGWDFEPVNAMRAAIGLGAIERRGSRVVEELMAMCARVLSVLPREFDAPDDMLPANVRYTGPIFEEWTATIPADLPWDEEDRKPLVVVSFSTTYMHHEEALERVVRAADGLSARVLVTLGGGLEPHELTVPPDVAVRRYVPHAAVLPRAAAVITHAGMGTVMAAFAFGVPMLCMPLARDQPLNAKRVEALGAGRTITPDAGVDEVRGAIADVLASEDLRAGAKRMAHVVASYRRGAQAVEELESLLRG